MIRLTSGGMSAALLRHRHFEEDLDGGVEQGVHEALRGQAPLDQLFDDDQQPALNSDRRRNYGHTHTHTRTHTHTHARTHAHTHTPTRGHTRRRT